MKSYENIIGMIGNTPLLRLKDVSEKTGCEILGKAEFLNPGGSIKDRTALGIIRKAEKTGELKSNGKIFEGTAGNTGIGLTILANTLGYKSVVVMPMTQSREKIDSLELFGAELHLVPATTYNDPNHYTNKAKRLCEEYNKKILEVPYGLINLIILQIVTYIMKQPVKKFGIKPMAKWMHLYVQLEQAEH